MRRHLIHLLNAGLLILVFIVFPAITGRNLGALRLSDHAILTQLTLSGLGAGIALNGFVAWFLIRTRKERALCVGWGLLLGVLLLVVAAQAAGWIHFQWFKEWLLRVRARF